VKFVADESVDAPITAAVRDAGHQVYAIVETEPGATDEVVLARSVALQAIPLKRDKDFGELVVRSAHPARGVILIRLPRASSSERAAHVSSVVREHSVRLDGSFVVISPRAVRIRPIP
jgi:predicted nuclease of predicted toxin-antitoxin system